MQVDKNKLENGHIIMNACYEFIEASIQESEDLKKINLMFFCENCTYDSRRTKTVMSSENMENHDYSKINVSIALPFLRCLLLRLV